MVALGFSVLTVDNVPEECSIRLDSSPLDGGDSSSMLLSLLVLSCALWCVDSGWFVVSCTSLSDSSATEYQTQHTITLINSLITRYANRWLRYSSKIGGGGVFQARKSNEMDYDEVKMDLRYRRDRYKHVVWWAAPLGGNRAPLFAPSLGISPLAVALQFRKMPST